MKNALSYFALCGFLSSVLWASDLKKMSGPRIVCNGWNPTCSEYRHLQSVGLLTFIDDMQHEYGSSGEPVHVKIGPQSIVILSNPRHIKELLSGPSKNAFHKGYARTNIAYFLLGDSMAILERGDLWNALHKAMDPEFSVRTINTFKEKMHRDAEQFTERFAEWTLQRKTLDVTKPIARFALHTAAINWLQVDLTDDELDQLLDDFGFIAHYVHEKNVNYPFTWPSWHPTAKNQKYQQCYERINKLSQKILDQPNPSPLVANFIELAEIKKLSDQQLRGQIIGILFGGHDTTAYFMTMALYHLAQNPSQRKLLQEALGSEQEELIFKAYLQEVLRITPSLPLFARESLELVEIDGYVIPKGVTILFAVRQVHLRGDLWEDPARFDLGRFLEKDEQGRMKLKIIPDHKFIPFGIGERSCIGRFFTMTEASEFLKSIVKKNIHFKVVSPEKVQTDVICTGKLKYGLELEFLPPQK